MNSDVGSSIVRFADRYKDFPTVKGQDGFWTCRFCKKPVIGKKWRYYCSEACETEVNVRCGWNLGYYIDKRDSGICADCGLDCRALEDAIEQLRSKIEYKYSCQAWQALKSELGKSGWEYHHVLPVHKGGGKCGLDNYITLCVRCHKKRHGRKYPLLEGKEGER